MASIGDGIRVELDAARVEQEIVSAIIDSSLGKAIEEAINRALKPSYRGVSVIDDAVQTAVYEQVRLRCRELVREGPVHDVIEAALASALTPDALEKIVAKFVAELGMIQTSDITIS